MKRSIPFRHIAVEGPIGVGKTSLVKLLAERFEGVMVLEDITNPFLPSFYEGRPGAAFQVQIYFLLSRFQQQREIAQMDLFHSVVLADYTFQKDRIFAYLNLDDDDLAIYEKLYPVLEQEVPKPDLVIYMQASVPVLLERIRRRGREYESGIEADYLKRLSEAYSYFFFHYRETPLLVVNTDSIDFVNDAADFDALVDQIARCRRGTQVYVPLGSKRTETLPGTEGEPP
ncbi:MAG TPA: deoxynucleoside kinase [Acidobacteria bacterium]|nr:deoxynucleoside kinase [Acidobacteriota bacterium]